MAKNDVRILVESLDEAFRGPAWHGPSLRAALRGVNFREAAARPARGRHNIWELAVHAAFWKYAVRGRLLGTSQGRFPYRGRNWFTRPAREEGPGARKLAEAWERDLNLLSRTHVELREVVIALSPAELDRPARGHRQTPRFMIEGIAMHDVYHAGQIQLLRRLVGK